MGIWSVCMSVYHMDVDAGRGQRGHWIFCIWSHRWLGWTLFFLPGSWQEPKLRSRWFSLARLEPLTPPHGCEEALRQGGLELEETHQVKTKTPCMIFLSNMYQEFIFHFDNIIKQTTKKKKSPFWGTWVVVVLEVGPRASCVCSTTTLQFLSHTSVLTIFRYITNWH